MICEGGKGLSSDSVPDQDMGLEEKTFSFELEKLKSSQEAEKKAAEVAASLPREEAEERLPERAASPSPGKVKEKTPENVEKRKAPAKEEPVPSKVSTPSLSDGLMKEVEGLKKIRKKEWEDFESLGIFAGVLEFCSVSFFALGVLCLMMFVQETANPTLLGGSCVASFFLGILFYFQARLLSFRIYLRKLLLNIELLETQNLYLTKAIHQRLETLESKP